ncbi:MAG: DNA replication/repair protein RecF [Opitutaceae bacterium]
MILREIRLQDFRNIAEASLRIDGLRCFLVGANGQGKTNLLESLGYISALRAFRPGDNRVLIREGSAEAAMAYQIEHEKLGPSEVLLRIRPKSKEALFDGNPVRRLADIIGRFPTVLFASEDIQLLRGSPALRRRFLDLHLASIDPVYLEVLQHFHRALEQRNRLLKDNARDARALAAFEQQLAPAAVDLAVRRRAGVAALSSLVTAFHARITDGAENAAIEYHADLEAADAAAFLSLLERHHARDLQLHSTQRGPHRDDLLLRIDGREASLFGSEGQQRALVLALRFAQLRHARERTGMAPVVLADDVLGELDPARRARFWAALDGDVQLFATGTALPAGDELPWQVFRVEQGRFARI